MIRIIIILACVLSEAQAFADVQVYRAADGDKTNHRYIQKFSPSSFRIDSDGLSTFEEAEVGMERPCLLRFQIVGVVSKPIADPKSGSITNVDDATGTYTSPPIGHWSIKSTKKEADFKTQLVNYAKTQAGVTNVNPNFIQPTTNPFLCQARPTSLRKRRRMRRHS